MFSPFSEKYFLKKNKLIYKKYKKKPNYIDFLNLLKKGIVPRAYYGLSLLMAAKQAKDLGYKKIKVFELGCDNLDGLVDIENYINDIKKFIDIDFEIYGFTLKGGLPKYKVNKYDRLYRFSAGQYKLRDKINLNKLKSSKIIYGDIKHTIPKFIKENKKSFNKSPISLVIFDLDYYTSTKFGLNLLKLNPVNYLPRTYVYFDDHSFSAFDEGERRAISEFNKNSKFKISDIAELAEQLCIFFNKWIYLGKRIKVINYYNHPKFNKSVEQLFG